MAARSTWTSADDQYFADANFDDQNRALFAFASYNMGPGNTIRMRNEAKKRGLDPNKWFNNVEIVTAEKIGMETDDLRAEHLQVLCRLPAAG